MKKKAANHSPADKAFLQSDRHTLSDLKLEPWTPDRILAFQALGGLYPNLGKEGAEQFKKTNVYPGAARDVCLFVYLSQLPPEEVDGATWAEAKAFGTKRGLHITDTKAFWEAFAKFLEVHQEVIDSFTTPKTEGGDPPEDDDDPKD